MLGTNIGNYAIERKIGEGGMGAVFLARHTMLGRFAAVKVLLPELSRNREIVGRFFNEARAATSIRHPGIVEIYDFGYLPDASAYIIMEFLDGESLSARIRKGTMGADAAFTIVRQIAGVLDAAHRQGIVHRDLKPDNVFLVRDPEMAGGERIKLLDFGIAKLAAEIGGGEASRTRTGAVMGTPLYMSPEQCRGAGTVDHRADLYALGCILFELSCGRPPFVAEGAGDIIAHHLYFQPQAPSAVLTGVPPHVDRLALWLLQKDPAARPGSAAELIGAIDATGARASAPGTVPQPYTPSPPHPSPAQSVTTLSGAAGAGPAGTMAPTGGKRWAIAAAAAAVVIAVVALLLLFGGDDEAEKKPPVVAAEVPVAPVIVVPPPPPPPAPVPAPVPAVETDAAPAVETPPPEPATIRIVVDSVPSGAEVVYDGNVMGLTPMSIELPPGMAKRSVTVRKRGYANVRLELKGETSYKVTLKKAPPARGGGGVGVNPFE